VGARFSHHLRVRFNECDPQGIVFNANYLLYADIAITELYREAFGSWGTAMDEHGIDMLVAEANVRYLATMHFDERFELLVKLARIGNTSTTTEIEVSREGETIARIEIRHVVIDARTRVKAPIPEPMRVALQAYA
jgi:acyl-CoA thioester hydrolase